MRTLTLVVATLVAGCVTQRTVGQPSLDVRDETVRVGPHDKVDILFMIDNSPSMAPKQTALRASFPELVTRIASRSSASCPRANRRACSSRIASARAASPVCMALRASANIARSAGKSDRRA